MRDAYQAALDPTGTGYVGLPALRDELAARGITRRDEQDALLTRLANEKKILLVPEENQKTLTDAQRHSAVTYGGEPNHLVKIDGLATSKTTPAVTTRAYAHQLTPDDAFIWTDPAGVDHEVQIRSRRIRHVTMPDGQPGIEVDVEGLRGEGYPARTVRLGLNEPVRKVDKRATAARGDAAHAVEFEQITMRVNELRTSIATLRTRRDNARARAVARYGDLVDTWPTGDPDVQEYHRTRDEMAAKEQQFRAADESLRKLTRRSTEAAGHDVTPGHDELHHFWTRDPRGLARWVKSPHPFTTLTEQLMEHAHVPIEVAHRWAGAWFQQVFGFAAGSDLNRVTHGHAPRGHLVGPG